MLQQQGSTHPFPLLLTQWLQPCAKMWLGHYEGSTWDCARWKTLSNKIEINSDEYLHPVHFCFVVAKMCGWTPQTDTNKQTDVLCASHPALPTFSTGRWCHSPSFVSLKRDRLSCCCIKILQKYKRSSYGNYRLTHRWLKTTVGKLFCSVILSSINPLINTL